jgi:hypothetical protein
MLLFEAAMESGQRRRRKSFCVRGRRERKGGWGGDVTNWQDVREEEGARGDHLDAENPVRGWKYHRIVCGYLTLTTARIQWLTPALR